MGLFTKDEMSKINEAARRSKERLEAVERPKKSSHKGKANIDAISAQVEEYFKDSKAILIDSADALHEYVDKCIEAGYCAIDTETTGLDRIFDTIVGFSLYYPGGVECYVPNKHLIYIFDEPYKNQLSYEDSGRELQRLVDAGVKMIFANADYDLSMIYKDLGVDMCDVCYYDVILAWRCLKENEPHNGLKELYNKYVLGGKGDPKRFTDFFSVDLFPYCKPSVAKLYAANDAKITYELFKWQLPYTIPNNPKCKDNHLEGISEVIWNLEFPMIKVCAMMHRNGIYFDQHVARKVQDRYHGEYAKELSELHSMVQDLIDDNDRPDNPKRPFKTGEDFNPISPIHVSYLCYALLHLPDLGGGTGKAILRDFALPQTDKILKVRSLSVLINTFIDKLIKVSGQSDGRIHPQFKSVGADTGRMSCIARGTMISSPGGDKEIQDLKPGDLVYCYDVDLNQLNIAPVKNVWMTGRRECIKLKWESGYNGRYKGELICTPDHFIRTLDYRWVMAEDLDPDDMILFAHREDKGDHVSLSAVQGQGNEYEEEWVKENCFGSVHGGVNRLFNEDRRRVYGSEQLDGLFEVYDIEVDGYHNFIANELCVHNSAEPNAQNIPSHASDIRHMFRATPGYVMFSSDYSQQEPKLLAYCSHSKSLCDAFAQGKDIYATIAAVAFHRPYNECLEFNPDTGEYQPDGKERRGQAKSIVLGITYGRSTVTIGEQLFGSNKGMSDDEKTAEAQKIYDSVLRSFPDLKNFMERCQESVRRKGYTETILGRRRHIPDMQLPRFEFKAMPGYVNPDVDPLDISTLGDKSEIPDRIVKQLTREFNSYKYFGQIVKRTKELREQKIRVINNTRKITDATRQCVNGVVQGSAADLTKMAILNLESNGRWGEIGGRLLIPVHDELICEVPMECLEEGREILRDAMEGAGDFLPFKITCDVETTLRWYGLEYPCKYDRPAGKFDHADLSNMTEGNIKWIQYHLIEAEYRLPIFKDADGNDPIGDAAKGVSGEISDEMVSCIVDYEDQFKIDDGSFINHIEEFVEKGMV